MTKQALQSIKIDIFIVAHQNKIALKASLFGVSQPLSMCNAVNPSLFRKLHSIELWRPPHNNLIAVALGLLFRHNACNGVFPPVFWRLRPILPKSNSKAIASISGYCLLQSRCNGVHFCLFWSLKLATLWLMSIFKMSREALYLLQSTCNGVLPFLSFKLTSTSSLLIKP